MIQVLIAESDSAVSKALCLLLQRELPPMIITEVSNVESLIQALTRTSPDVLLLDWNLYGSPALETYRLLKKAYPHLKVILLSADASHESAAQAIGVNFVNTYVPPEELVAALYRLIISEISECNGTSS